MPPIIQYSGRSTNSLGQRRPGRKERPIMTDFITPTPPDRSDSSSPASARATQARPGSPRPQRRLRRGQEVGAGRDRPELRGPGRRGAGHRGRVRFRKERQFHGAAGPAAQQQPGVRQRQARRQGAAGRRCSANIRDVRGKDVAVIFQEPMTALNPVYTVGSRSSRRCGCTTKSRRTRPRNGRCGCWSWWSCRTRRRPSSPTRTSSPAASGSAP